MSNDRQRHDEQAIVAILKSASTIAMVGASPKPSRDSNGVMRYLQAAGYRVLPVNPTAAGQTIHGERVYSRLGDIKDDYEIVDVFRRPDAVPEVVDDVLPLIDGHGIRCLWLQLGVVHPDAAARAREAGLEVVMDRCIKVEHARLRDRLEQVR